MNTVRPGVGTGSRIDLHCHSTASDGTLPPAQVVAAAHAAGVATLALTDHDSVAGLGEARATAQASGIHFVNGVELSTRWNGRDIHIVGLDFKLDSAPLLEGLESQHQLRRQRARAIAAKLEKLGLADAYARVGQQAGGGQITRAHFARLLIEAGICRDARRAFKQILGPGKRGYVASPWPAMEPAIGWIIAAGGSAVLAHPLAYRLTHSKLDALLTAFRAAGGTAMEVCTGNSDTTDIARMARFAQQHTLLGSVGSDFHDPAQRWRCLGGLAPLPPTVAPVWEQFRTAA